MTRCDGCRVSETEGCTCGIGREPDDITTVIMDCPVHADSEWGRIEAFITEAWEGIREL